MMFLCAIYAEGAPSLRFLQEPALSLSKGRVVMLPTRPLSFRTNPVAYAFVVPALCKLQQRTGHPPFCLCQRNQKPGPPATNLGTLAAGLGNRWANGFQFIERLYPRA
jgi:hypothetical protein